MLLISREELLALFSMRDAIESNKRAFITQSRRECDCPLRTSLSTEKGECLVMSAHIRGLESTGVKIVSVFPGNRLLGKPTVPATMILLDGECGEVLALLDGTSLTQMRTGALTGAATEILARDDASVGALFGCGGQAPFQLLGMLDARRFAEIRVYDPDEPRLRAFVEGQAGLCDGFGTRLVAARSAEAAVEGALVITAATTSSRPVFPSEAVAAGAHVNGIGSYTPPYVRDRCRPHREGGPGVRGQQVGSPRRGRGLHTAHRRRNLRCRPHRRGAWRGPRREIAGQT